MEYCIGSIIPLSVFRNILIRQWKSLAPLENRLFFFFPDVDECLNNYEVEKKVELAKWHTVLKEQLGKILPLDEEIYAELIADEKSTEEDIMAEIELHD